MSSLNSRVQSVFREIFDQDTLVIADQMSAADILDWDSLAQVKLVLRLEDEFDIKFTTNEVAGMKCIGDLKGALRSKGVRD